METVYVVTASTPEDTAILAAFHHGKDATAYVQSVLDWANQNPAKSLAECPMVLDGTSGTAFMCARWTSLHTLPVLVRS